MALEHILAVLEEEYEAQAAEIQAQATAEVQQLVEESEADASAILHQHREAIRPRLRAEQSRRINVARMEAQRVQLEMKDALVGAVFDAAQSHLARARQRPDYDAVLATLIEEVLDELGTPVRLAIDRRDLKLVHDLLSGSNNDVSVEPSLKTWGGVVGRAPDGLIWVDNTLETRFNQVQENYRASVADLLEEEPHAG